MFNLQLNNMIDVSKFEYAEFIFEFVNLNYEDYLKHYNEKPLSMAEYIEHYRLSDFEKFLNG